MDTCSVNLTIYLKNGDTKLFTKPVRTVNKSEEPSHIHLNSLHGNILQLQKESNIFLTTVVENEKAEMQEDQSKKRTNKDNDDDADDDDDDDEEDEASNAEPESKKKKT
ncbi:E3 ubiquitin-protein ligase RNF34-like [Liolophura sinensis]|uniref:E3 ubiquitin-protein ligase RNF34-like n=1 Tax=Liolophura sinensis TaxID=3198878 RepID=UPI0031592A3B